MARHCPDCEIEMVPKSFFGVLVDTCPDCAGIFFDEGEVNTIREHGGARAFFELDDMVQPCPFFFPPDEPNIYRKCPACLVQMRRIQYLYTSPVTLDSCDTCGGVFIENGELQQMKAYLEAGKSENPTDPRQVAADIDIHTIEQKDRANRLHSIAGVLAFYPFESAG